MKSKYVTALLAIFLGWLGVHRFYLGQRLLGVLYIILLFAFGISFIVALIDFLGFLFMSKERFDFLYNRRYFEDDYQEFLEKRQKKYKSGAPVKKRKMKKSPVTAKSKREGIVQMKQKGKELFNNYEYHEAVEFFKKILAIDSRDPATHFNLACSYSILENKELAFRHLGLAIENGFDDFERIKNHPKLAYLRVQVEWDELYRNRFRASPPPLDSPRTDILSSKKGGEKEGLELKDLESGTEMVKDKILVKLKKLKDLRDRGEISDTEFSEEKGKLL